MVEKLELKKMKIHKHKITKKDQRYHKIRNMYKYLHFHNTITVSYNNDVSLQNALSLVSNFTLYVIITVNL